MVSSRTNRLIVMATAFVLPYFTLAAESCPGICTSLPESCSTISKDLITLWLDLSNCFQGVDQNIKAIINELDNSCNQAIEITEPTTFITVPGVYCLVNDVKSINIFSSNVVLNLNNHTVSATSTSIRIDDELKNIFIYNGIIDGSFLGVTLRDLVENVTIAGVTFQNCNTALRGDSNKTVNITNCAFINNSGDESFDEAVVYFEDSSDLKFHDIVMTNNIRESNANNPGRIFYLNKITNANIEGLKISNNSVTDSTDPVKGLLEVVIINNSNNINIQNSFANNNTAYSLNGFNILSSNNITLTNCQANSNTGATIANTPASSGFNVANSSTEVIFSNCQAQQNNAYDVSGFALNQGSSFCSIYNSIANANTANALSTTAAGFKVNTAVSSLLQNNTAINNSVNGYYLDVNSNSNVFFSNYAQANGTNFNAVIPGPISVYDISATTYTPAPTAWSNISAIP